MKETKEINLAMAWWGTGWHVFPVKSLIQHINKHTAYHDNISKIVRFWEENSLEKEMFLQLKQDSKYINIQNKLHFESIISGKYRRETRLKSRLKNVRDAFKFLYGILQSLFLLHKHKIDVVFCKWGYVALPVVLAAKILKKRILVHESDVHSWLVNKISARFATKVFTGFDWVLPKSQTVGQILSDDIIANQSIKNIPSSISQNQQDFHVKKSLTVAEKLYYSDPDKTHLIVMWGSQWSKRLYQDLLDSISQNNSVYKNYEIFVILWKENQNMKEAFHAYSNITVFDFVSQQEIGLLLKNCDIALTRAGTTSLAEQKLYDLKIVMVPIPRTHDQYDNARFYVKKHKDILLDSKDNQYTQSMLDIFTNYQNFKKTHTKKNILSEISIAKDIILEAILN